MTDQLFELHLQGLRLERPYAQSQALVRVGEYMLEHVIRLFRADCVKADGGVVGPICAELLPGGLKAEIGPQGQAQFEATGELLDRVTNTQHPNAKVVAAAGRPALAQALGVLESALVARTAAGKAVDDNFKLQEALRSQHRVEVVQLQGQVQSTFPDDTRRQDAVFPEKPSKAKPKAKAKEPGPGPGTPS